jgi:hypothetical protein
LGKKRPTRELNAAKRWLAGAGMSFLFTCKEVSHPWWWLEGVSIRDGTEKMAVNYLSLSIWNEEKRKETYHNEWITNKPVNAYTVEHLAVRAGAVEDRERAQ